MIMKNVDVRKVASELLKIEPDVKRAARLCVAGYVSLKKVAVRKNSRLAKIVQGLDCGAVMQTADIMLSMAKSPTLEELVGLFELMVPESERKKSGVAYTPHSVKDMMLRRVLSARKLSSVCDPSCGCGSFLITAARMMHERTGASYRRILTECLVGADISSEAISRAEMLFSVLLSENGEDDRLLPKLYCLDMLKRESVVSVLRDHARGFDCVVGNPPYVRFRNLDRVTQRALGIWKSSSNGNADLYMPFFEIGWQLVSSKGALAFITSNTYLQSVNGRSLRNWISEGSFIAEITDFREAQLFENVTCYTCVTVLSRTDNPHIRYRRVKTPDEDAAFSEYGYTSFGVNKPWRMRDSQVDLVVARLEAVGRPLGEYVIRNGLATLANDVFFFKPEGDEDDCYVREFEGRKWKIEKALCRDIIKPNVVHTDRDLLLQEEKAIFPYDQYDKNCTIKSEQEMKNRFPLAYAFLSSVRARLDERDKGDGNYPAWYAYGRTQGMNSRGCKLLIPYIAGEPTAVLAEDPDLLFYCGYALFGDVKELRYVRKFLESDAFWYYLYHTSKPYSKGFMALAKNYIVGFSIPSLPPAERAALMAISSKKELNKRIWSLYGFANAPEVPAKSGCKAEAENGTDSFDGGRINASLKTMMRGLRATGTDDACPRYEQMSLLKRKKAPLKRKARTVMNGQ